MCKDKFRHFNAYMPLCRFMGVLLLLFIFTMLPGSLTAQKQGEDYSALKSWQLPASAVAKTDLNIVADLLYQDAEPFTGWAFERYAQGQILEAAKYQNGLLHGPCFLWYPDGSPQMSANYRSGALHGRFLGWYANGNVIYDRYINRGAYAKDNLGDEDDGRLKTETEILEGEGRDNDNTRE